MYEKALRPQVSQGDVFDQVPITYVSPGSATEPPVPRVVLTRAIVMTHDCEYDKPNCDFVIVAEIRRLDEVAHNSRGNVRERRTRNTFFLDSVPSMMEESFVDFRRLERIHKSIIQGLAGSGHRVVSLTDDARAALQWQVAVFFGYGRQG